MPPESSCSGSSLPSDPTADCATCPAARSRPTALVTGGGVRVGLAIVQGLIAAGYDVASHYCSSVQDLARLKARGELEGFRVVPLQADFIQRRGPSELAQAAVAEFGGLDLLVNNAALFVADDAAAVDLAKMKLVNVDAPEQLTELLAPALAARQGSVINIADIAGLHSFVGYQAYSRTKAVLLSRTCRAALRLASQGVRVNAICPGTVLPAAAYTGRKLEALRAAIPLGRIGLACDVANAVVFLAGATFITGQILCVDGGRTLLTSQDGARSTDR